MQACYFSIFQICCLVCFLRTRQTAITFEHLTSLFTPQNCPSSVKVENLKTLEYNKLSSSIFTKTGCSFRNIPISEFQNHFQTKSIAYFYPCHRQLAFVDPVWNNIQYSLSISTRNLLLLTFKVIFLIVVHIT